MTTMYEVQPFAEVHVDPANIMYKMASYHAEESASTSSYGTNSKKMSLKELINSVAEATSRLAISMKEFVEAERKKAPAIKTSVAPKKDNLDFEIQQGFSRASAQFHYKLIQYEPNVKQEFHVYSGPKYHHVIKLLKELGENRKVSISYRDASTDGIYVETETGGKKVTEKSSVSSFLLIGEAIGVYSNRDHHLAGSGEWISMVDDALHGRISLDQLIRAGSRHLGASDLLTKSCAVSLADLIFYAAVHNVQSLPNNVELFTKRVSEALSTA